MGNGTLSGFRLCMFQLCKECNELEMDKKVVLCPINLGEQSLCEGTQWNEIASCDDQVEEQLINLGEWYCIRAGSVHICRNTGNTECLSIAWNIG